MCEMTDLVERPTSDYFAVSVLNWNNPGDIVANTTVVPTGGRTGSGPGGSIQDFAVAYNGPSGQAQVVVDVVGVVSTQLL
jgi:hypothetical protein